MTWWSKVRRFFTCCVNDIETYDDCAIREAFVQAEMPPPLIRSDHSHPEQANNRSRALQVMDQVAMRTGLTPYDFQMSKDSQRKGREGYRAHYWWKDHRVSLRNDPLDRRRHIVYMVDVDFHMETLEEFMAEACVPVLMYTIAPTMFANSHGEYTWTFDDKNHLVGKVAGAAEYDHQIWSFDVDCITFTTWNRKTTTTYLVERRQIDPLHAVVLFCPIVCARNYSALWMKRSGNKLIRFEPVKNGVGVIHVKTAVGDDKISIGLPGVMTAATLSYANYAAGMLAARQPRAEANVSTFRSWVDEGEKGKEHTEMTKRIIASVWLAASRKMLPARPPWVSPVYLANKSYSCNVTTTGDGDEGEGLCRPFMSPLDNRGYTPRKGNHTAKWAAESRVLNLITENKTLSQPATTYRNYMFEFARAFATPLTPVELQDVYDNQQRPTQKRQIWLEGMMGRRNPKVSAFVKAEVYPDIKDPRVITQFDASLKLPYSRFTMAVAAHIKTFPWYGFKQPIDIANHMVTIAEHAEAILETDFSRFDGHVTELLRDDLDVPILMHCFPNHREELLDLYKQHKDNNMFIGDFFFNSGSTQSSGSADTSVANTWRNRAIIYVAWRLFGKTHEEAFNAPGMHAGDDGVVPIYKPDMARLDAGTKERSGFLKCLEKVCRAYGQKLEVTIRPRGQPFAFLARYFNAWYGDNVSCSDIQRQMKKIHMSVGACDNPRQLLYEKAAAFALTDAHTPILGDYVMYTLNHPTMMFAAARVAAGSKAGTVSWWSQYNTTVQFPNSRTEWMDQLVLDTYPEFNLNTFYDGMLSDCDPLAFPLCVPDDEVPATKVAVALGGDVLQPNCDKQRKDGKDAKTNPKTPKTPQPDTGRHKRTGASRRAARTNGDRDGGQHRGGNGGRGGRDPDPVQPDQRARPRHPPAESDRTGTARADQPAGRNRDNAGWTTVQRSNGRRPQGAGARSAPHRPRK